MTTSRAEDHVSTSPAILYFGTPVVLLSTTNADGTPNLAPISSAFWLDRRGVLGVSRASQSWANMARTGEVVLALPSADQVGAVDRLALTTGKDPVPAYKRERGYRQVRDKFTRAGLSAVASDLVEPPRVAQCPIAMECRVESMVDDPERAPVVEVTVERVHAHPGMLLADRPNRIDPDAWRPLIMSFQRYYGLQYGELRDSTLATIDEEHYRS